MGAKFFTTFLVGIGLFTSSLSEARVTRMSKKKAWNKTPIRYFTTKQKAFYEKSADYFGEKVAEANIEYGKKIVSQDKAVIPFLPFSFNMDFDIVLAVNDGLYSMYEIIRVDLEDGSSLWLTLDSKHNGKQYIGLPKDEEQKKVVKNIASLLGAPTYESDLVVTEKEGKEAKEFLISYTRKDVDAESEDKAIELKVTLNNKFDLDNKKAKKSIHPKNTKRLSHGMNHSSSSFLALIDIHKTLPFTAISNLKVDVVKGDFKFQKILGIKVKSVISQLVSGIGKINFKSNSLDLISTDLDDGLERLEMNNGKLKEGLYLQNISYDFSKKEDKRELESITIKQNKNKEALTKIEFSPALPDLRYDIKKAIVGKVAITMDGRNGVDDGKGLVSYVGQYFIEKSSNGNGYKIELIPGDANISHRKRFKKTPEWIYARPIVISLQSQGDSFNITSTVMSPQDNKGQESSDLYVAKKEEQSSSLSKFKIKWDKRPHRLSRLVIRNDSGKEHETQIVNLPSYESRKDIAYFLGGTWGNGQAASDKAHGYSCGRKIVDEESRFYSVSSRSFPLTQNLKNFPFNAKYLKSGSAKVEGFHKMTIKLDQAISADEKVVAYINGIRFDTGPNHHAIGTTYGGVGFEVFNLQKEFDGRIVPGPSLNESRDEVTFYVSAHKYFGPELTRPATGPIRQNLLTYSAFASLDLTLAVISKEQSVTVKEKASQHVIPFQLHLPGNHEAQDAKPECEEEGGQLKGSHHLVKLAYTNHNKKPGMDSPNIKARYMRSIEFNMSRDGEVSTFHVDNTGEVTWRTIVEKSVGLLEFE